MKLFVWDFHGVLEKDNDLAVLEISNSVLEQAGHAERFDQKSNQEYYGLKWFQYFERLLPHLSKKQHMALQAACFEFAEKNTDILAKHIKPNDHSTEVIKTIHGHDHDQIILSNTRPHDLLWFVNTVGLSDSFPNHKIIGVNAHEKHHTKKDALKQYIENKQFDDLVIIGDSQSDMDLKDVAGGTTYYYSHPHIPTPSSTEAKYIINDLRKVLNEL